MTGNRHSRQIAFFGDDGQKLLAGQHVVIIGVGGVGSHIAQQLAFLGIGTITIIDDDKLADTNLNRLIGYSEGDKIGMPKVDIIERLIKSIDNTITVIKIKDSLMSEESFDRLKNATAVFGCIDNDGARFVLNEFCLAYERLYFDIASDIMRDGSEYGGRVIAITDNKKCLYCLDEIDKEQAARDLENPEARQDREAIYGVSTDELEGTGPSVVSINGVVASLAVTEYMLHVTGKRSTYSFLNYSGSRGIVTKRNESETDCYYCKVVMGQKEKAKVEQYIKKVN